MAYLKFVGQPGEHLVGVPGRDLSKADQESLTDEARELLNQHLKENPRPIWEKVAGDAPEDSPAYEPPAPRRAPASASKNLPPEVATVTIAPSVPPADPSVPSDQPPSG